MKRRLTAIVAAGALLTACHPPHQQPSSEKVQTATEQVHAPVSSETANVKFIDCVGEPTTKPHEVSTDCANPASKVTNIEWSQWSRNAAQGKGTGPDGAPATVKLSAPTQTGESTVYSTVEVNGEVVSG
ncbi:hypothetical protein [Corynebacterium tapiri]|uniref:Secreted protein n=1 Tax=Corynebacterium tapiri TaxID=1448266 RepID=A0A5C4U7Z1_9CORY|nr:hypothetical protein [Corynebacterium tapiri]TNM00491.1 hypothetical protein FHE74_00650 [Corynebacterium tapiri]